MLIAGMGGGMVSVAAVAHTRGHTCLIESCGLRRLQPPIERPLLFCHLLTGDFGRNVVDCGHKKAAGL